MVQQLEVAAVPLATDRAFVLDAMMKTANLDDLILPTIDHGEQETAEKIGMDYLIPPTIDY